QRSLYVIICLPLVVSGPKPLMYFCYMFTTGRYLSGTHMRAECYRPPVIVFPRAMRPPGAIWLPPSGKLSLQPLNNNKSTDELSKLANRLPLQEDRRLTGNG